MVVQQSVHVVTVMCAIVVATYAKIICKRRHDTDAGVHVVKWMPLMMVVAVATVLV